MTTDTLSDAHFGLQERCDCFSFLHIDAIFFVVRLLLEIDIANLERPNRLQGNGLNVELSFLN